MDTALYWFGVAHAAAYAIAGVSWVMIYSLFWIHWKAKLIRPILEWYSAKLRWAARDTHGLSKAEWDRGEPKP